MGQGRFLGWVLAGLTLLVIVLVITKPEERQIDAQKKVTVDAAKVTVTGDSLPEYEADAGFDPAEGMDAPSLKGLDALHEPIEIAPGEDQPTLVIFLTHWCDSCDRQVQTITDWAAERTQPDGVRIVAVVTASDTKGPHWPPSKWLAGHEWPFPTLYDDRNGEARAAYGVSGFPHFVLIGNQGTIVRRETGYLSADDLDAIVEQAIEGITSQDDLNAPEEPIKPGESDPAPPEQPGTDTKSGANQASDQLAK
jgi:thiol-disulfide isomerase/thioredoxin